jgi:alkylation response protein AidB-like acyl-CoA dehydrogenase
MDIRLSEEQIEIARQARKFLEKQCPTHYVRAMCENDVGFTDDVWNGMTQMGWTAMRVPEAYGGLGLDLVDVAVLMEEMGRAVMPGPFFSTVLLGVHALTEGGTHAQKERWLPGMAAGHIRGTLALYESDGGADPSYIHLQARPNLDGFILHGTKLFVPDAHVADFMVVAARTIEGSEAEHGISLFFVPRDAQGVTLDLMPTMDGTRKLAGVEFNGVRVTGEQVMGKPNTGWTPLRRVLQAAQVGIAADSVGVAQRAMEIAVDYAKIRVQFDQPIGSFQAIKHRCARMFEEVESARSVLYWAAWAQDHADTQEAALAASTATAYCTEVASNIAASAIQVLGGTGFSWEHDIHLYLKRAKANEVALGDPAFHREQLAALLESDSSATSY